MPKRINTLSDVTISKAKPKDKEHCLYDGEGLYIVVGASMTSWENLRTILDEELKSLLTAVCEKLRVSDPYPLAAAF